MQHSSARNLFSTPLAMDTSTAGRFILWAGEWREKRHNGTIRVDVDGPTAHIAIGSGPAADYIRLTPLDERRAIFERAEGPRKQRVCISFSCDGTSALLATLRSRVLRFERA